TDSTSFCLAALECAQVNVVPGAAFGAEGFVRLSYATSREQLQGGLDRLEGWLSGKSIVPRQERNGEVAAPVEKSEEEVIRELRATIASLMAERDEYLKYLCATMRENLPFFE